MFGPSFALPAPPQLPAMSEPAPSPGHIFTSRGWLPPDRVRLVQSVEEDADKILTRTDKFDVSDGAWVGNDLHVHLKHPLPLFGIGGTFS
jgi:hypothetical protein